MQNFNKFKFEIKNTNNYLVLVVEMCMKFLFIFQPK